MYNATQDDATFKFLARTYSMRNPRMAQSPVGVAGLRWVGSGPAGAPLLGCQCNCSDGPCRCLRWLPVRAVCHWRSSHEHAAGCPAASHECSDLAGCRILRAGLRMAPHGTPSMAACRWDNAWSGYAAQDLPINGSPTWWILLCSFINQATSRSVPRALLAPWLLQFGELFFATAPSHPTAPPSPLSSIAFFLPPRAAQHACPSLTCHECGQVQQP